MDPQAPAQLFVCEVCGSFFETRRGLSNHARLHLRQLGVSEPGAAPIDLLYQLIKERDGAFPSFKADSSVSDFSSNHQRSHRGGSPVCEDESTPLKAEHRVSTTPQSTSLLPLSASALKMVESRLSDAGSTSTLKTLTKPLWAPLETDAPITLDTTDEVHVCHLCGCWCETRKGLSSHARSHLRQLGIPESEIKGSPIDTLYQLMEEEDLKPINCEPNQPLQSSSLPKATKRPADVSSPLTSTPNKLPKASGNFSCILCGETFENHKGLAIHSRYHLRHFGMNDLLGKESSIEAIQELVESGVLKPLQNNNSSAMPSSPVQPLSPVSPRSPPTPNRAPKAKKGFRFAVDPLFRKSKPEVSERSVTDPLTGCSSGTNSPLPVSKLYIEEKPPTVPCDYCGQLFETRKALSCHVRCHLRELGVALPFNSSPIDLLREVMMQSQEGKTMSSVTLTSSKVSGKTQGPKRSLDSLVLGEHSSKSSNSPLDFSMKEKSPSGKLAVTRNDTSCELCGFEFDNRKALASHARAHLRQLGIEWKPDGSSSPIELLSEIIRKDPTKVAEITQRYRMGDLYIKKTQRPSSPSLSTDSDSVQGSVKERKVKEISVTSSFKQSQNHLQAVNPGVHSPKVVHSQKHQRSLVEENQETSSQQTARPGSIPAMLPKPPLTPLVKVVGKVYSLKCRFCDEVFHGPVSVQEKWITHLQKHILTLGYKGKASPPAAPVKAPALVRPVAV